MKAKALEDTHLEIDIDGHQVSKNSDTAATVLEQHFGNGEGDNTNGVVQHLAEEICSPKPTTGNGDVHLGNPSIPNQVQDSEMKEHSEVRHSEDKHEEQRAKRIRIMEADQNGTMNGGCPFLGGQKEMGLTQVQPHNNHWDEI